MLKFYDFESVSQREIEQGNGEKLMLKKGVVAAGHKNTAEAAITALRDGGNAFDAVVAAHLAACVVEPVLSSLAGGSFLLARPVGQKPVLYDFFVQTPMHRRPVGEIDFRPISADFGTAQQEFHIGLGTVATPGTVKGLFQIHRDLCLLPMPVLAEPAIRLALDGVNVNSFQAYIFDIVQAIYKATPLAQKTYGNPTATGVPIQCGDVHKQPDLADCLDAISREGEDLFYQGEIAKRIVLQCREDGGNLEPDDLGLFQVIKRKPLSLSHGKARIFTNPSPSSGGILVAFALKLLESISLGKYQFGDSSYLGVMAQVQKLTSQARIDAQLENNGPSPADGLLNPEYLDYYKKEIKGHPVCSRGTTHISVIDGQGNIASLTTSNGEGCGHMVPGTGIMLNNMLGEEDLNPGGFHRWPTDQRMTSMMAPTIAFLPDDFIFATGSGGSNRLRTAILQVLVNLVDFGMSLTDAVNSPRIHFECDVLNMEPGFDKADVAQVIRQYPNHKQWEEKNLFFGGAHSVAAINNCFEGAGDPRRGGVVLSLC